MVTPETSPVEQFKKKPLRILIGADMFPPEINGAARFAERLAGALVRGGHDVHIIAPSPDKSHGSNIERHDGVPMTVHRIRSHRWYPHESYRFSMPFGLEAKTGELIDQIKPDAVHLQSHLVMGRALAANCRQRGIRFIATNHFMPENLARFAVMPASVFAKASSFAWKDLARVYRGAFAITTPTQRAAELLESSSGIRGVIPISCGLDASMFATDRIPGDDRVHRIIYVGRLNPEKRIDVLLKAVATLPAEMDVRVDLVGDGDQRKPLEQLAESLGIRSNVNFLGYITDAELPGAYAKASVFAMPSIAELQSIATMEAMASGLPVVAANAMALPHLCHDGINGYLFDADDVDDLAAKLLTVLTAKKAERKRLSANSRKIVSAHDINQTVETFERLYRGEVVSSPNMDVAVEKKAS